MFNSLICLGQGTEAQAAGGMNPLVMPIILGIMVFWMFRSQKKVQAKERTKREELLASIKSGDKVVTAGGIMAEVVSVKDTSYVIKIAEKVNIEISKNGIGSVEREEKEEAK